MLNCYSVCDFRDRISEIKKIRPENAIENCELIKILVYKFMFILKMCKVLELNAKRVE